MRGLDIASIFPTEPSLDLLISLLRPVYASFIPNVAECALQAGRRKGSIHFYDHLFGKMISGTSLIAQGKRLKFAPGTRIVGKQNGPSEYRSRLGKVIEYLGASLYRIKFDDTEQKEYVLSQWLEAERKYRESQVEDRFCSDRAIIAVSAESGFCRRSGTQAARSKSCLYRRPNGRRCIGNR